MKVFTFSHSVGFYWLLFTACRNSDSLGQALCQKYWKCVLTLFRNFSPEFFMELFGTLWNFDLVNQLCFKLNTMAYMLIYSGLQSVGWRRSHKIKFSSLDICFCSLRSKIEQVRSPKSNRVGILYRQSPNISLRWNIHKVKCRHSRKQGDEVISISSF